MVQNYLILAALLPLASFLVLIFFGRRFGYFAGPFASSFVLLSLGLSVMAFVAWIAKPQFEREHYVEAATWQWLPIPAQPPANTAPETPRLPRPELPSPDDHRILPYTPPAPAPAFTAGTLVDSLTILMFLMVSFIASLVHIFSIAFMAGDPRYPRYFAYLGLFSFAMLAMILSNSLLQLFVFWQLAALCTYLLIGFWFERRAPAAAALKSFVLNRVGDAMFLVAIGILVLNAGSASLTLFDNNGTSILTDSLQNALGLRSSEFLFNTGDSSSAFLGLHWMTWVGLLLCGAAAAKSALFPLQVWLPDATEAPAPAVAFISSGATVVAGVYLVARIFPILTMDARLAMSIAGCVTLAMAALVAMVQTDLKRILAWSTISQLGFIMLFLGAGGYIAGLMHLFTHAFFNACLMLAVAAVVHALDGQSDVRRIGAAGGGLWKKMPITAATFLLAGLALAATPFFSGALSRNLGLASVYQYAAALPATSAPDRPHYALLLFYAPVVASYLTAFYIARAWWLTFAGRRVGGAGGGAGAGTGAGNDDLIENAYEPAVMTLPLILLASLSFAFWYDKIFEFAKVLAKSLPNVGSLSAIGGAGAPGRPNGLTVWPPADLGPLVFSFAGWTCLVGPVLVVLIYYRGVKTADRLRRLWGLNLIYIWLRESMFFDALYNGLIARLVLVAARVGAIIDRYLLDSVTALIALVLRTIGQLFHAAVRRTTDTISSSSTLSSQIATTTLIAPRTRLRTYLLMLLTLLALAVVVLLLYLH